MIYSTIRYQPKPFHTIPVNNIQQPYQTNAFSPYTPANKPSNQPITPPKPQQDLDKTKLSKNLLTAAGLISVGLLLNRIPPRPSAFELVSTRLEDWAKMGLGVVAVGKINDAFQWNPPPWLQALGTVSVLTLISQGLNLKRWRHFPLLAIGVPLLVQATHWLDDKVASTMDRHNSNIPRWIPKVLIATTSTISGIFALRGVLNANWYRNLPGQPLASTSGQVIGAEAVVCARCGGQHLICMEEVSDLIGTLGSWLKGSRHHHQKPHTTVLLQSKGFQS